MEKSGWQVTAGLLAIACLALGVGIAGNRTALAETTRQLHDAQAAKKPEMETLTVIKHEPCPSVEYGRPAVNQQCKGGVLLERTSTGWTSVTSGGRAIACDDG